MRPTPRAAGIAGVLAGVGLAVEGFFWMTSGWTPETFGDPGAAMAFLRDSGGHLRAAVFAGVLNLVFTVVLIAGLADRLRAAPTPSAATLHFGLIGVAGHGLVPLALWFGVPMFVAAQAAGNATARGGWVGFAVFLAAAGGLGSLFLGASTLATGWGALSTKALPAALGWVAVALGAATVLTVLTAYTPLAGVGAAVYFPSLLLAIVFRTWAGIELWRSARTRVGELAERGD